jgi:hypothetical protein
MALGTPVLGTLAYSASGGTSVAPSYPASIVSTDVLVLIVGQQPNTAAGGTVTTPSGWTLRASKLDAGGYGTTTGVDVGNSNLRFYTKDTVTGSESGTLTVTVGDNNVCWAGIIRVPTGGGAISFGSTTGSDSAGNATVDVACDSDPGFIPGDMAIWSLCIPTDVTTPAQFSAHAMNGNGAVFGAATELAEPDSSTGGDIGGFIAYATVSSGTSAGNSQFTATAGGTTTNVRGPGVVLRIREGVAPLYKGSLGKAVVYKGLRSDAQLYKGAKQLWP